jgi:riboflavin kinase/FMN adenylyltransferase
LPGPSVITIGTFDGVHAGHAALVGRAREIGGANSARVVAVTFDPHPLTRLRPDAAPPRLTTFERKSALLRAAGADEVVRLTPDDATLHLTAEEFVRGLVEGYAPVAFVEGPTFRFGHGRAGDTRALAALGTSLGFTVEVLEPVEVTLCDGTVAPATSSLARWLIERGRVRDAAAVLGRPYCLDGVVVRGEQRGRTIGFPTANVRTECLAPGDGVYAGVVATADGRRLPAALSVGTKPTFGNGDRAVEAFVLNTGSAPPARGTQLEGAPSRNAVLATVLPGLPEYGWPISVEFHAWVRDQVRFGSVEGLIDQMRRDCDRIREIIGVNDKEAATCP